MAAVSCEDCQRWIYGPDWRPIMRAGQPMPRPPSAPTPCDMCPKIPDGTRKAAREQKRRLRATDAAEWSADNRQTWLHYWATKAGSMPEQDPASREMVAYLEQIVQLSTRKLQDPARLAGALADMLGRR